VLPVTMPLGSDSMDLHGAHLEGRVGKEAKVYRPNSALMRRQPNNTEYISHYDTEISISIIC
jgi:hypothetical protein